MMSPVSIHEDDNRKHQLIAAAELLQVDLDSTQSIRLLQFVGELQRWNRTYNLTAIREADAMVQQHLLDSLAVLPWLDRWLEELGVNGESSDAIRVLDVGSGGGLPGVVLALMRPTWLVTCVDAVEKKMSFVRQMSGVLGLPNLLASHARVERLEAPPNDLVISRAFASLSDFVTLAGKHVGASGILVAMKGKYPSEELAELAQSHPEWHRVRQTPLQIPGMAAERCLLAFQPGTPTDLSVA